ncbi:MAG TPA: pseudouridine synthase [Polyangiaceae bacterium]|nr:pseudouridine synthase [Polyangiaceae bacterium]
MTNIDALRPLPRRLRKRVAESLALSLQLVDEHWQAGRLRVITPERELPQLLPLEALVFPDDQLLFDGAPVEGVPTRSYALLNKPIRVTSTAYDPEGMTDLSPYLRQMPGGCFPVGRLDRETSGLLLCTSDGDLANAILRPDHETTKTYWLWLDDLLEADDPRLVKLCQGVEHHGQLLAAKHARISARSEYATELELTLTSGKKRQIRHMCRLLDLHLQHLHRCRIGSLSDAGLALGTWRPLSPDEVETLWADVGGKARLRQRKVAALVRLACAARAAGDPNLRLEAWLAGEKSADEIDRAERSTCQSLVRPDCQRQNQS